MNLFSLHLFRILLFLITVTICTSVVLASETGTSHNLFYIKKLNDKSFFVGRANLVTRDGFSDTFFGYADANYRYSLTDHWAIEAGYRHAFLDLDTQWREEYRPMFALYWRGILAKGNFSNRHRLELRYFEGNAKDRVRYRNESVWQAQRTITHYQLRPYIEEEIFYDTTDSEFTTNWLTFGISKKWSKSTKWKLGYRLQSQKFNDKWENRHVLVTGISIALFD